MRVHIRMVMCIWTYAGLVIWALVHTKGGVAKTTTCMFLAAAASRRGLPVRVVDADPQGSASSWADRAAHLGTPLPFEVVPATAADLRELVSKPGELIVVDTPPGTAAAIDAAIDAADLVIIPTGPRAADIDRVWPTLDITAHRPTTVLLTLVDMRKVEAEEMPRGLLEANAPVLSNIVRDLTAVERAFGRGIPRYLGDYGDVFDELSASVGLEEGVTV
jgi:chromosome partitioning protein